MTITPEDIEKYQREQDDIRKWEAWRKRANKRMPELAARVFALREKGYPGCGFHYAMEGQLGLLIHKICDPTKMDYHSINNPIWSQQVILEVSLAGLIKSIWLAEHNGGKAWQRRLNE